MIEKVFDAILAMAFIGLTLFGAVATYDLVRIEALRRVSKGLQSSYRYTRSLTGDVFSWEK